MRQSYGELVRETPGAFEVHTNLYTSRDVFDAEMENIFERGWVFIGHESQIAHAGDCLTAMVGRRAVVATRTEQGGVVVLENRCSHCGGPTSRVPNGTTALLSCPTDGTTYGCDGSVVNDTGESGAAGAQQERPLLQVACTEAYRGLIFVKLAADGPSLGEHLRPVKRYIDWWFNRSPLGTLTVLPQPNRYAYPGNWKWQAENGTDAYHGNYVHDSWQRVLARAGEAPVRDVRRYRDEGCTRGFRYGHGLIERPAGLNPNASWTGRMMLKYPEYADALRASYSSEEIQKISTKLNIYVFPNLYLFDTHIRTITPSAVDRTQVDMWVYALDGVPDELNQGRYRAHERFFGPAGFGTPDDIEIFVASQTGMQARSIDWALMSRGMHREVVDGQEVIGHTTDEVPARALYREWRRVMSGA